MHETEIEFPRRNIQHMEPKKKSDRGKTLEDLRKESIAKYGDVFSFGFGGLVFKNWSSEIGVTCNICAIKRPDICPWTNNTPTKHIKYGCVSCTNEKDFKEKSARKYGDWFDSSLVTYINQETPVKLICMKHEGGLVIDVLPRKHLERTCKNGGCKLCRYTTSPESREKSRNKFFVKARSKHGDVYIYDKVDFKGSNVKVIIICKIHGEFEQTPDCHTQKNGKGCHTCGIAKRSKTATKEHNDWMVEVRAVHGDVYLYPEDYVRGDLPITIVCRRHGEFPQRAEHHKDGHGCPTCGYEAASKKKLLENGVFIGNCEQRYPGMFSHHKTKYTGSNNTIIVTCNNCGTDSVKLASRHYGYGTCPTCADKSKGEAMILELLQKRGIKFMSEFRFPGSLRRYDFMVFASDEIPKPIMLEFDGIQHFKRNNHFHACEEDFELRKQVDVEKTLTAIKNGYAVVRIDHKVTDINVMDVYLDNAITCAYDYDILISSDIYTEHIHNVTNAIGYDVSMVRITDLI